MSEIKHPGKKVKNKNLNVKFPEEDINNLQDIADKLGGMTLSGMIRMLVYSRLDKVKKSGDPRDFVDLGKDK
jgi:hypothetical protein